MDSNRQCLQNLALPTRTCASHALPITHRSVYTWVLISKYRKIYTCMQYHVLHTIIYIGITHTLDLLYRNLWYSNIEPKYYRKLVPIHAHAIHHMLVPIHVLLYIINYMYTDNHLFHFIREQFSYNFFVSLILSITFYVLKVLSKPKMALIYSF